MTPATMDIDSLVSEITKRVMNYLSCQSVSDCDIMILSDEPCKDIEGVLGSRKFCYYKDSIGIGIGIRGHKIIICPSLSLSQLSNIANGAAGDSLSKVFIDSVAYGLEVIQLREGMKYQDYASTMPKPMYNMYKEYEGKLRSFGIKLMSIDELRQYIGASQKPSPCDEAVRITKKAVTELDIRRVCGDGKNLITLAKGCIITPLAADYIRENHILVNKE